MYISSIRGLKRYIKRNSDYSIRTINSVIIALGYHPLHSTQEEFKKLSGTLKNCSKYGAQAGFTGFTNSADTIRLFKKHRQDIVFNLLTIASECDTDVFSFVQNFRYFHNSDKPTDTELVMALSASGPYFKEVNYLYNVFAWYTLEKISHTWNRYLEEHPALAEKLSA